MTSHKSLHSETCFIKTCSNVVRPDMTGVRAFAGAYVCAILQFCKECNYQCFIGRYSTFQKSLHLKLSCFKTNSGGDCVPDAENKQCFMQNEWN